MGNSFTIHAPYYGVEVSLILEGDNEFWKEGVKSDSGTIKSDLKDYLISETATKCIETMILNFAMEGVDITLPNFCCAIESSVDEVYNTLVI